MVLYIDNQTADGLSLGISATPSFISDFITAEYI
jgi:hypothetical protein